MWPGAKPWMCTPLQAEMNDLKSTHSETSMLIFIHWKLLETNITENHDTFAATSCLVGGAAATVYFSSYVPPLLLLLFEPLPKPCLWFLQKACWHPREPTLPEWTSITFKADHRDVPCLLMQIWKLLKTHDYTLWGSPHHFFKEKKMLDALRAPWH